jgi:signal transduction histidine kinase
VHTDAQRAEQILRNMLANAFKFTERGSVTLEVGRPGVEMDLQRTSLDARNAIAFSVIDTGIGIEPSKFKDIFEAFQQENGSIDRHYGGTGLGLTIARKFAHMLGGEIHVASQKGKGSRFTLVLPVNLARTGGRSERPHRAPSDAPHSGCGVHRRRPPAYREREREREQG